MCPRCGEYDLITIGHNPYTGATEMTPAEIEADEGFGHAYCRNCDWGLCEFC